MISDVCTKLNVVTTNPHETKITFFQMCYKFMILVIVGFLALQPIVVVFSTTR